jgi:hypothetical protein
MFPYKVLFILFCKDRLNSQVTNRIHGDRWEGIAGICRYGTGKSNRPVQALCLSGPYGPEELKKTELRGLSPLENYTDRVTAACRLLVPNLRIEGATWSA